MMEIRRLTFLTVAVFTLLLLVACRSKTEEVTQVTPEEATPVAPVEVTRVIAETVVAGGAQVAVTRVVSDDVEVTALPEDDETMPAVITYNAWSQTDIATLDPQTAADSVSINYIENLFVQLTNYELGTADIVPEAATEWEVSDDGLTYTFHIRTDIPWVYYDPTSGETKQVNRPLFDQAGRQTGEEPAFVTANDFVYGIKRACDPNMEAYYSSIIAPLIVGCIEMLNTENPANIPQAMIDAIGVSAPDESTLVVELAFPASYFLSMTPMWTLTATPEWAIVANGENWIEAGNIVTSGRYVLEEWDHGVRHSILRNEL